MASPSPKLTIKTRKDTTKKSDSRAPSSPPDHSLYSVDSTREPSSSCPSLGPPSPPSAPTGPIPLPPTYSLINLAPAEIGWNWETATLGPSTIASFPTTTTTDATPLDRYLGILQRHEMIALDMDRTPMPQAPAHQPNAGDNPMRGSGDQCGPLTSLAEGPVPLPGSPSRRQEVELSSLSWSSVSTVCSTRGAVGHDVVELDVAMMRLKLAELNRKRTRGKPRTFKQARMKKRDARKKAKGAEDSSGNLEKGEKSLEKQSP